MMPLERSSQDMLRCVSDITGLYSVHTLPKYMPSGTAQAAQAMA